MLPSVAITGWGHYVPDKVMTNQELESLVDTSDEWIRTRTGIHERRIAAPGETTSSMCAVAARQALERAALASVDLDLVICATTTPDHLVPATACLVQQHIGAAHAGAFDINAACTGFLYALAVGAQFIQAGTCARVLVVAGETMSRFTNWKDRNTCVLLGDGAAALVLEATEQPCGVLGTILGSQGDTDRLLAIEAGGSAKPATAETVARGEHYLVMRGSEVFKMAVRAMSQAAREVLVKANLSLADIRMVFAHQANGRILRAVQQDLGLPREKFYLNLDRFGNTAAASVPTALSEFLTNEPVEAGENLLLAAFGGGLTWAAAVIRWADVPAVIAGRTTNNKSQSEDSPLLAGTKSTKAPRNLLLSGANA
jgi:3-oxoacyl-[acyl-carrier-protein] synthase-3